MFGNIINFFKKLGKNEKENSKSTAKERLHLVLAQDRAHISADFLEMMKQEIIEVIKKYIDIDEEAIDVRMTNKTGEDGTVGAPALYANIPIVTIKNEARKLEGTISKTSDDKEEKEKNKEIDENQEVEQNESSKESDIDDEENEEDGININMEDVEKQGENVEEGKEDEVSEQEEKKENVKEEENEEKNS